MGVMVLLHKVDDGSSVPVFQGLYKYLMFVFMFRVLYDVLIYVWEQNEVDFVGAWFSITLYKVIKYK